MAWIKNVARSFTAVVPVVAAQQLSAMKAFRESTSIRKGSEAHTVMSGIMRDTRDFIKGPGGVAAAFKNFKHAAVSGKLYDEERANNATFAAMGDEWSDGGGFDDSSSVEDSFSESGGEGVPERDGDVTNKVVNVNSGGSSYAGFDGLVSASATAKVGSQTISAITLSAQKQLQMLEMVRSGIESFHQTSAKFYTANMTTLLAVGDQIEKLNNTMNERYRNDFNKKSSGAKVTLSDIITNDGELNIAAYMKYLVNKGKDSPAGGFMGVIKETLMDPMGAVVSSAVESVFGSKAFDSLRKLNDTIADLPSMLFMKLDTLSKDPDSILGKIAGFLNIKDARKTSVNTSNYNKGPIPFDGVTKKAIVDVIPGLLSDIIVTLKKGTDESKKVFDYDSGQMKNVGMINKEIKSKKTSMVQGSFHDDIRSIVDSQKHESKKAKDDYTKRVIAAYEQVGKSGKMVTGKKNELRGTVDDYEIREKMDERNKSKDESQLRELNKNILDFIRQQTSFMEARESGNLGHLNYGSGNESVANSELDRYNRTNPDVTGQVAGGSSGGRKRKKNKSSKTSPIKPATADVVQLPTRELTHDAENEKASAEAGTPFSKMAKAENWTLKDLIQAPMKMVSKVADKLDSAINGFLFGSKKEDEDDSERKGFIGVVKDKSNYWFKRAFFGEKEADDEKTTFVGMMKDKLDEATKFMKGVFNRIFTNTKEFLFGNKSSLTDKVMKGAQPQQRRGGGPLHFATGTGKYTLKEAASMRGVELAATDQDTLNVVDPKNPNIPIAKVGPNESIRNPEQVRLERQKKAWNAHKQNNPSEAKKKNAGDRVVKGIGTDQDIMTYTGEQIKEGILTPIIEKAKKTFNDVMDAFKKTFKESIMDPVKKFLWGKKGDDGEYEGGALKSFREGLGRVKDKSMKFLFGDKVTDEDGVESRQGGIFGKTKDFLSKKVLEPSVKFLFGEKKIINMETGEEGLKGGLFEQISKKFGKITDKVVGYLFGEKKYSEKFEEWYREGGVIKSVTDGLKARLKGFTDGAKAFLFGDDDDNEYDSEGNLVAFGKLGLFGDIKNKYRTMVANSKNYLFGEEKWSKEGKSLGRDGGLWRKTKDWVNTKVLEPSRAFLFGEDDKKKGLFERMGDKLQSVATTVGLYMFGDKKSGKKGLLTSTMEKIEFGLLRPVTDYLLGTQRANGAGRDDTGLFKRSTKVFGEWFFGDEKNGGVEKGFFGRVIKPLGGILYKEIIKPFKWAVADSINSIKDWWKGMGLDFKDIMDVWMTEFKYQMKQMWEGGKKFFKWGVDKFKGMFETMGIDLGDLMQKNVLGPIRSVLDDARKMVGKVFGFLLKKPLEAFKGVTDRMKQRQIDRGLRNADGTLIAKSEKSAEAKYNEKVKAHQDEQQKLSLDPKTTDAIQGQYGLVGKIYKKMLRIFPDDPAQQRLKRIKDMKAAREAQAALTQNVADNLVGPMPQAGADGAAAPQGEGEKAGKKFIGPKHKEKTTFMGQLKNMKEKTKEFLQMSWQDKMLAAGKGTLGAVGSLAKGALGFLGNIVSGITMIIPFLSAIAGKLGITTLAKFAVGGVKRLAMGAAGVVKTAAVSGLEMVGGLSGGGAMMGAATLAAGAAAAYGLHQTYKAITTGHSDVADALDTGLKKVTGKTLSEHGSDLGDSISQGTHDMVSGVVGDRLAKKMGFEGDQKQKDLDFNRVDSKYKEIIALNKDLIAAGLSKILIGGERDPAKLQELIDNGKKALASAPSGDNIKADGADVSATVVKKEGGAISRAVAKSEKEKNDQKLGQNDLIKKQTDTLKAVQVNTGIVAGTDPQAKDGWFDKLTSAWDKLKEKAKAGVDAAKSTYDKARSEGSSVIGAGYEALKAGIGAVASAGETGTKKTETEKAGMISGGKGDAGGKSYGEFQFASKRGSLGTFLKESGYGKQFEGMQAGSAEFDAKWKELAKDPKFAQAQKDQIGKSHFQPQLSLLKGVLDTSKRWVQEVAFSTGVQYGPTSKVVLNALKGVDTKSMSDTDLINKIQDYKASSVAQYFPSSSPDVQKGVANRHGKSEKARLLALVGASAPASSASTATAKAGEAVASGGPSNPDSKKSKASVKAASTAVKVDNVAAKTKDLVMAKSADDAKQVAEQTIAKKDAAVKGNGQCKSLDDLLRVNQEQLRMQQQIAESNAEIAEKDPLVSVVLPGEDPKVKEEETRKAAEVKKTQDLLASNQGIQSDVDQIARGR